MFKHRKRKYGTVNSKKSFLRFLLISLIITIFGFALIGVIYFVNYSDFFLLPEIIIQGDKYTDEKMLRNLIISDLIAQKSWRAWFGPHHLFFWLGDPESNISKYLPSVKKVAVQTDLKNRKVVVNVSERNAFGVICVADDLCFGFDKDGVIFTRAPAVEGFLILKIVDSSKRSPQLGHPVLNNPNWIGDIISVSEEIRKGGLYPKEIEIKDIILEEWAVKTSKGLSLLFSLHFKPGGIRDVLEKFMKDNSLNTISVIDFRIPDKVYYK